jgi:hypothetical protein
MLVLAGVMLQIGPGFAEMAASQVPVHPAESRMLAV